MDLRLCYANIFFFMECPLKATMVVRNRLATLSTSDIPWVSTSQNANASSVENDLNNSNLNNTLLEISNAQSDKMTAKAILICRDNSHPFQERKLSFDHPVKIGRSVARAKATPTNAIFDCKVLSRNHAILWYDSGKFYLQDTKSSNGTFVNNSRLSSSGQESVAREVCSGDIVQFGVDVVENTKKLTHGCIVATLKLYLPDGREAKASSSNSVAPVAGITFEDLYTLNQFLQEAGRREQALNYKLSYLKQLVRNTQKAANQSWKALIDEDRLLSRVEIVESQLVVYSKNFTEDKVRNELVKLQEEKAHYQNAAKEAVHKILQEKQEVSLRLMQLETRLNETEEECQSLHEVSKHTQAELQELAAKYTEAQKKLQETTNKLMESEEKVQEVMDRMEEEKKQISKQLKDQCRIERVLLARLHNSRLDSINVHKQVTALRNYMQTLQDAKSKQITDENFESKDDVNDVQAAMAIILNKLILSTKPADIYDDLDNNVSWQDNQVNSQDSEGLKSFPLDVVSFKEQINDSISDSEKLDEYILPPSRRTLVNGNADSESCLDVSLESDTYSDFTDNDDTCSVTSVKFIEAESNEKSCDEVTNIEEKRASDKNGSTPPKLEVRFASDENGKQLETRYYPDESIEAEVEEADSGNNSSDSQDSPLSPIRSITVTVNEVENRNEVEKTHQIEDECEEHMEGEYVKTLKPLSKNDSSQTVQAQEYILQSLIGCLDSLKEEDSQEAQNIVKRELDELKDWLLREPNEAVLNKLKDLYYRSKNETQRMQEINEELVILKEKYNAFTEEKAELIKNYMALKTQCSGLLNANYTVPIHYVLPIALVLIWMLLEKLF